MWQVRTTSASGLDTRLFNVFRQSATKNDFEDVLATEPGCAQLLSAPFALVQLDLNAPAPSAAAPPDAVSSGENWMRRVHASVEGVFNCLVTWTDLDLGDDAGTLTSAPDTQRPRHRSARACRQQVLIDGDRSPPSRPRPSLPLPSASRPRAP